MSKKPDFESFIEAYSEKQSKSKSKSSLILIAYDVNKTRQKEVIKEKLSHSSSISLLKLLTEENSFERELNEIFLEDHIRNQVENRADTTRRLILKFVRTQKNIRLSESAYAIKTSLTPAEILQLFKKYALINTSTDILTIITLQKPFEAQDPYMKYSSFFSKHL